MFLQDQTVTLPLPANPSQMLLILIFVLVFVVICSESDLKEENAIKFLLLFPSGAGVQHCCDDALAVGFCFAWVVPTSSSAGSAARRNSSRGIILWEQGMLQSQPPEHQALL